MHSVSQKEETIPGFIGKLTESNADHIILPLLKLKGIFSLCIFSGSICNSNIICLF